MCDAGAYFQHHSVTIGKFAVQRAIKGDHGRSHDPFTEEQNDQGQTNAYKSKV